MIPWLETAVSKHPDRAALIAPSADVSYADLAVRAGRLARERRLSRADRVALEFENKLEFAIQLHACLLVGATAVPVDTRLSVAERAVRAAAAAADGRASAHRVATVMHTSGTTAAPKLVELTYDNWQANALASAVALGLDPAERWLCAMPLTHVGGLSILIRSVVYATTVVLHDRFETERVIDALSDPAQRITMVSLVPTMLARLLDAGLRNPPTLRWALLGGGPIAPALLERAEDAGVPVAPTYGMTEACSQIATFGFPLSGVDVRLDGPENEILVRGPIVSPGALDGTGWLRTGDLGDWDERGRLVIVGRKADTIVTGGENVAPAEVEAVLLEHPAVADAGVFPRPDAEWGEAVIASVVLTDDAATPTEDELRAHCAARLARFKVPKRFEFATSLPRTESGKLVRRELS